MHSLKTLSHYCFSSIQYSTPAGTQFAYQHLSLISLHSCTLTSSAVTPNILSLHSYTSRIPASSVPLFPHTSYTSYIHQSSTCSCDSSFLITSSEPGKVNTSQSYHYRNFHTLAGPSLYILFHSSFDFSFILLCHSLPHANLFHFCILPCLITPLTNTPSSPAHIFTFIECHSLSIRIFFLPICSHPFSVT